MSPLFYIGICLYLLRRMPDILTRLLDGQIRKITEMNDDGFNKKTLFFAL